MAYYPLNGPHHKIEYTPNTISKRIMYANCPNCGAECFNPKVTTRERTVIRVVIFFPYVDIETVDAFRWVCPACGTNFTTPTLDYRTIKP